MWVAKLHHERYFEFVGYGVCLFALASTLRLGLASLAVTVGAVFYHLLVYNFLVMRNTTNYRYCKFDAITQMADMYSLPYTGVIDRPDLQVRLTLYLPRVTSSFLRRIFFVYSDICFSKVILNRRVATRIFYL